MKHSLQKGITLLLGMTCMFSCVSQTKREGESAVEFMRNLSEDYEILTEVKSQNESLVYYKAKDGKEFYRKNLDTNETDTICPKLYYKMEVFDIVAGKEHIMVCSGREDEELSVVLYLYNLKSQKFKEIGGIHRYSNDLISKIIYSYTYSVFDSKITTRALDYDGNLIREEQQPLGDDVSLSELLYWRNEDVTHPVWKRRLTRLVGIDNYRFMCEQYMGGGSEYEIGMMGSCETYTFKRSSKENWDEGFTVTYSWGNGHEHLEVSITRNEETKTFEETH